MTKKQTKKRVPQKRHSSKSVKQARVATRQPRAVSQTDAQYFVKILFLFILGTFWVRLIDIQFGPFEHFSIPAGLFIGLFLVSRERLQIDRKLEYVILIAATFVSFYLPVGITI